MIIRRKKPLIWMMYTFQDRLIHIHDVLRQMAYDKTPICENACEIEPGIFILSLAEGNGNYTRYLQIHDGITLVQRYTISEEEYWQLNPVPF